MKEAKEVGTCRSTPHGGYSARQSSVHVPRKERRTSRRQNRERMWRQACLRDYERLFAVYGKDSAQIGVETAPVKKKGIAGKGKENTRKGFSVEAGRKKGSDTTPGCQEKFFPLSANVCDMYCTECLIERYRWNTRLLQKRRTYDVYFSNNLQEVDAAFRRIEAHRTIRDGAHKFMFDERAGDGGEPQWKKVRTREVALEKSAAATLEKLLKGAPAKETKDLKKYCGKLGVREANKQVSRKKRKITYEERVWNAYKKKGLEGAGESDLQVLRNEVSETLRKAHVDPGRFWATRDKRFGLKGAIELGSLPGWVRARAELEGVNTKGYDLDSVAVNAMLKRFTILETNHESLVLRIQNAGRPLPQSHETRLAGVRKVRSLISNVRTPSDFRAWYESESDEATRNILRIIQ